MADDYTCWDCGSSMLYPGYGEEDCPKCGATHEWEEGVMLSRANVESIVEERDRLRRVVQHYRDNFKDYCQDACMENGVAMPGRNQYPPLEDGHGTGSGD